VEERTLRASEIMQNPRTLIESKQFFEGGLLRGVVTDCEKVNIENRNPGKRADTWRTRITDVSEVEGDFFAPVVHMYSDPRQVRRDKD